MKRCRSVIAKGVNVFDAALIRALVNCTAGLEYESAIADARSLQRQKESPGCGI